MAGRLAIRRRADGTFGWKLTKNEREVLTHLAKDFRALLTAETPSSDPSLQRLFPPALDRRPRRGASSTNGRWATASSRRSSSSSPPSNGAPRHGC